MQSPKETIKQIQALTYGAYQASGQAAALIGASRPQNMAEALEQTAARMEQGTIQLRALCERCLPPAPAVGQKPALSPLDVAGKTEVNEFGWLHIQLNTLLPHCRFAPPLWLTDTISRLLDQHERRHGKLPLLEQALLVIDEYCDVDSRQVYDADNKGWKAVSNAIKQLFPVAILRRATPVPQQGSSKLVVMPLGKAIPWVISITWSGSVG